MTDRAQELEEFGYEFETPNNQAIEAALVGCLILNNRNVAKVSERLRPEHFYIRLFGRIYAAVCVLVDRGEQASPLTLKMALASDDDLEQEGGVRYLVQLGALGAQVSHADSYAETVIALHQRRELLALGQDLQSYARNPEITDDYRADVDKAALEFEGRLANITSHGEADKKITSLANAGNKAVARVRASLDGSLPPGLSTGLADLDRALGGLHAPDLLLIGARPGMGKTAMLTTNALAAARAGKRVAVFSMEMSAEQLAQRILADISGISAERQRHGIDAVPPIAGRELASLDAAAALLENLPLWIDDTPGLSPGALRARATRLARHGGLDLILVDYLQLMRGDSAQREQNRVQELSQISGGLKGLAKELNVPVIALSQLSRGVEGRDDKRPTLADLRDSGSLEQDADVVVFLYREEEYLRRSEPKFKPGGDSQKHAQALADHDAEMRRVKGTGEVLIEKNRHGKQTRIVCAFNGERSCWADLARGYDN